MYAYSFASVNPRMHKEKKIVHYIDVSLPVFGFSFEVGLYLIRPKEQILH